MQQQSQLLSVSAFAPLSFLVLCLSRFSLWLSHLSLSVTLLYVFPSCTQHSSCSISVSFSLSVPHAFFPPSLSIISLFFHTRALCHSVSLPHTYSQLHVSSAPSLPLCQWGHCAGQTALRSPPATAFTCWEAEKGNARPLQQLGCPPHPP